MANKISPDMDFARRLFAALDQHWAGPDKGMVRPGYSRQESEAITLMQQEAEAIGMTAFQDLAGNAYFIYAGQDSGKPILMMGSHLDAVAQGGRYDGPAGVVAAMTAVKYLHDHEVQPPQDVCVVIWRNEEGPWFDQFAVGSKLAVGDLKADILNRPQREDAVTLENHMKALGLNTSALRQAIESGQPLIPLDRIGALLEVHIEQGSVLEENNCSLGIVTGIRGNVRFPDMLTFHGETGHTGTVPQEKRRDAVEAAIVCGGLARTGLKAIIAQGRDLVYSFPEISTPGAWQTKIPNLCHFRPEGRSLDDAVLDEVQALFIQCARDAASETKTVFDASATKISRTKPALMHANLQSLFQELAAVENITTMRMPSGAGHDAGVMAEKGVPAGMLFIRHGNDGLSHHPHEILARQEGDDPFAAIGDFCNAIKILCRAATIGITVRQEKGIAFASSLQACGGFALTP